MPELHTVFITYVKSIPLLLLAVYQTKCECAEGYNRGH